MALQISWPADDSQTRQAAPEAYVKAILTLANDTEVPGAPKINRLAVKVFASQAARNAKARCIYQIPLTVPAEAVNTTPAAYAYLKTLPMFQNAVDLL